MSERARQRQRQRAEHTSDAWTTRIDPETALRAGYKREAHLVLFQPVNDPGGRSHSVAVEIPEAEERLEIAMLNARILRARVVLLANTAKEAQAIAVRAARLLPEHRRVPIERFFGGGTWNRERDH